MNKKVIALAVAGALASPLAAQAQTANVTMYGTFRVALESTDLKEVGRNNHIDSWSSRWGIRGIESLGGGLNGIFNFEAGINLDNPGNAQIDGPNSSVRYNTITLREGWVGLNGGFGTIKMGAGLTPWDDVMGLDHLLYANGFEGMTTLGGGASTSIARSGGFRNFGSVGNASTATGPDAAGQACNSAGSGGALAFDARYGNGIRYDSPNFSGLTFATHFAFLGENALGFKCKGWDSAVQYNNGPIELGLGYARHIDFQTYDGNSWVLHAGYDFGVAKLQGQYETMKYEGNNGASGDAKARYYNVGVVVPLGPGKLALQYHNRNKGVIASSTAITEVDNGGGKHYSVSYKYGFSKRTFAYAWAAHVKAENGASIEGGPLGGKATSVGFGMAHNF